MSKIPNARLRLDELLGNIENAIKAEENSLASLSGRIPYSPHFQSQYIPSEEPFSFSPDAKLGEDYERTLLQQSISATRQESDTPQPKPTHVPRHFLPVEERLSYVKAYYDINKEKRRKEQEEKEKQQLTQPSISTRSLKLAEKSRGKGKIEDRLIEVGQKKAIEQMEREVLEAIESRAQATPAITSLASKLKRDGDVADRLLEYQKIYNDHMENLARSNIDESTYRPQIYSTTAKSKYLLPTKPVKKMFEEEPSFKPAISKRSEKLASRLGESTQERLARKPQEKKFVDEECTFKPKVNRNSSSYSSIKKEGKQKWEELYKLKDKKQEDIERLKKELENNQPETKECTFKPKLNKTSLKTSSTLFDRMKDWEKAKQDKIKQTQEIVQNKDLIGCTFAPQIKTIKGVASKVKDHITKESRPRSGYSGAYFSTGKSWNSIGSQGMNSEEADEPQEPREAVEAEEYPEIEYREDESMNFQEALRELHRELHSIALE